MLIYVDFKFYDDKKTLILGVGAKIAKKVDKCVVLYYKSVFATIFVHDCRGEIHGVGPSSVSIMSSSSNCLRASEIFVAHERLLVELPGKLLGQYVT